MTLCCVALGVWSIAVDPYRQQAKSLGVVKRLQGHYELVPVQGQAWQRWLVTTMVGPNSFTEVRSVALDGRNVDGENLAALAGLIHLQELNLDRTDIKDQDCSTLRAMRNLRTLSLRFTGVSDRAAEHLALLPELTTLYLTSTEVSDEAVDALAKLQSLDELYIRWTRVSEEGASELRAAMPNCEVYHYARADH